MKNWLRNKSVLWILSACMACLLWSATAAAEGSEKADVQFMKADGMAEVTSISGRVLQRYANMGLHNGDRICTGEDGSAWLGAKGGERLRLDAGSCLEIRSAYSVPEYLLESGNLYFHMEEPENGGMRIRTAAVALYTQDASGWLKVVDRGRVCVYLLSGTAQCSAADPVTGQIKQASLTGGRMAECTVRFEEQGDSRCEIDIRDFTEEAIEGFVLEELAEDAALSERLQETFGMEIPVNKETAGKRLAAAGAEWSKHMEQIRQECQDYAELRDPVWMGEEYSAFAQREQEEAAGQEEEPAKDSFRPDTAGRSSTGTPAVGIQTVLQAVPAPAAPEPLPKSPKKKRGSGSSAPNETKPAPETEPKPGSEPEPVPANPTEDSGIVIEGIAHNGPDGVIEVREGGKISIADDIIFCNEGKLTCNGIITGSVSNEGGMFAMSGKTLGNVLQKEGTTSITGGTVAKGCVVEGGTLSMSKGMIAEIAQKGGEIDIADGSVTGGCTVEGGVFSLSGGTVQYMSQNEGDVRISGGSVTTDCRVAGGVFSVSAGTAASIIQKSGMVNMTGDAVVADYTMEAGTFDLSGGSVEHVRQTDGTVRMSGGTVTADYTMEAGTFDLSGGSVEHVRQTDGTIRMSGGTVTADCIVESGAFLLSNGTVADVVQKGGTVRVSDEVEGGVFSVSARTAESIVPKSGMVNTAGDAVVADYTMEAGTFDLSGGSVEHVRQTDGTIRMSGGTVMTDCIVESGTFLLSGGTVGDVIQKGGTVRILDEVKMGDCTVYNGTLYVSGGTTAGVLQKGGTIHADGGIMPNGCVVEGGICFLSSGTVSGLLQKDGQVNMTGGVLSAECTIENGGFVLEGGTAESITQRGGKISVAGGTITNGCRVEGGKLEVSGGTLRAGKNDTALTVNSSEAALAEANTVTAENANVYITGGMILGDGADKSAIQSIAGTIMLVDNGNITVKADRVFHTIRTDKAGGNWAVRYSSGNGEDYTMSADSPAAIYVTKLDSDDMVRLRRLSDDFFFAAQAEDGDLLTLSGDMQVAGSKEPIEVTGGAKELVRLDLNGKKLDFLNQSRVPEDCRMRFGESVNWKISNGQITGVALEACNSGSLIVENTAVEARVEASDSGTVKITDSDLHGRIFVGKASEVEMQNCRMKVSSEEDQYLDIENKGGTLKISDSQVDLDAIYNHDSGTVSISKSSVGIFGSTGERTSSGEKIPADTGICNNGTDSIIELLPFSKIIISEGIYNTGGIRVAGAELDLGAELETFGLMEMSGGILAGSCSVRSGGSLRVSDGILSGGCEVSGNLELTGGKLIDGCRLVQGGSFRMTGGTLEAGKADAALSLLGGDIHLEGGSVIGNGDKGTAVWLGSVGSGNMIKFQADDSVLIKAQDALHTVQIENGGNWQFQYGADVLTAPMEPSVYVTKKDESDGMMCLKRLDTDFSRAAQAEEGDIITLGKDVTYEGIVQASGGTEMAPVTLDLNDKNLLIWYSGNVREVFCLSSGFWTIQDRNGQGRMTAEYDGADHKRACIYMEDSAVSITDAVIESDIWGNRGSQLFISNSIVGKLSNTDHSNMKISCSEMGSISSEGYSTADITSTIIQETKYPGGKIGNRDHSILKISGQSKIQVLGSGSNIYNQGSSELYISDTELYIRNGIENSNSLCHISNSNIKIGKYGQGGKFEISNTGDLRISASAIMTDRSDEGVSVRNAGVTTGVLTLSDVDLTGYIYSGGKKCILNQCNLTVIGSTYGVNAECILQIDGGEYRQADTGADQLKYMIIYNALSKGTVVHRLGIGGEVKLDTSGSDVIPLAFHKEDTNLETSDFEIIIGEAVISSGKMPAIRGFIIEDVKHPGQVTRQNIQITEGARILSECPEGTVIFENKGNCPAVRLELQSGEIINESQGPAICISDFSSISENAGTHIRTKGTSPLAGWTGSQPDLNIPLPSGYVLEEKDGYCCLVWNGMARTKDFTDPVLEESVDNLDVTEDDIDTEGISDTETSENLEDDVPEETDLPSADSTEGEGEPESGTESTESEEKPEDESESSDGEKEPESGSESTDGEAKPEDEEQPSEDSSSSESSLLPSADSDTEGAGDAPSSESDGSGDSSEPSEKDRRTEDAVLPPDKEEALKKEESESDQSGR